MYLQKQLGKIISEGAHGPRKDHHSDGGNDGKHQEQLPVKAAFPFSVDGRYKGRCEIKQEGDQCDKGQHRNDPQKGPVVLVRIRVRVVWLMWPAVMNIHGLWVRVWVKRCGNGLLLFGFLHRL